VERENSQESQSLEDQYFELHKKIDRGELLTLQAFDKLLDLGFQHYKDKARDGNELHEELGRTGLEYLVAKNGSYANEKAKFCDRYVQACRIMATYNERHGMYEAGQKALVAGNNWSKMKKLCVASGTS
jgi:hypothetical protein